jgi:hypothetical protein
MSRPPDRRNAHRGLAGSPRCANALAGFAPQRWIIAASSRFCCALADAFGGPARIAVTFPSKDTAVSSTARLGRTRESSPVRADDFIRSAGRSLAAARRSSTTAMVREPTPVRAWKTKRPAPEWNRPSDRETNPDSSLGCRHGSAAIPAAAKLCTITVSTRLPQREYTSPCANRRRRRRGLSAILSCHLGWSGATKLVGRKAKRPGRRI